MASKRTLNRLYWLVAKSHGSMRGIWIARAYEQALGGMPDSRLVIDVENWEYHYGPHKPHRDLNDATLWYGRQSADAIRDAPLER